ncbi:MAG TPA: ABC transporter substrate-binding protein [Pseudonocardiaceae bacterium]|nr:ABC transporter substrate-binding protein [Pseudonocardiaceae bacterium]
MTGAAAAACLLFVAGCGPSSSDSSSKITFSYSEVSASELPLLIASDAGYFKQQGLDVSMQSISAQQGIPAMLSDQVQFSSVGGSEVLSAEASGASMQYILTMTPVYAYVFYAQRQHATAASLRGQRVGIVSTSGSDYVATVLGLKAIGLTPSDVQMVPLGSVTSVNNALLSGSVVAAMSHPPASVVFDQRGFAQLVDLAKQRTAAAEDGIAVTKTYLDAHQDVAQKVCDAIVAAIRREKSDKAYTEKEIAKFLNVHDQASLDATYQYYVQDVLPDDPLPAVSQFIASQQTLAKTTPAVAKIDLSSLVNPKFVQQATSGKP